MVEPIYLLDFRHGTVKPIDESVPPRGVRDPNAPTTTPEKLPEQPGLRLAALGSPPENPKA